MVVDASPVTGAIISVTDDCCIDYGHQGKRKCRVVGKTERYCSLPSKDLFRSSMKMENGVGIIIVSRVLTGQYGTQNSDS